MAMVFLVDMAKVLSGVDQRHRGLVDAPAEFTWARPSDAAYAAAAAQASADAAAAVVPPHGALLFAVRPVAYAGAAGAPQALPAFVGSDVHFR